MTDRVMSEAVMLASLRDIRLPAASPAAAWADILMVVGLAGLAALAAVAILRLASQRRVSGSESAAAARARLAALPPPDRRVALLHLLRERAPDRHAALRARLYRPDGGLELAELEAEVARLG